MPRSLGVLRSQRDFSEIRSSDKCFRGPFFVIRWLKTSDQKVFCGFALGAKSGSAIQRNFVKRVVRTFLREMPDAAGIRVVVYHRGVIPSNKGHVSTTLRQSLTKIRW